MTVPHVLLAEQSFVDLAAFGDTDKARGNLRNPILRSCRVAATANVASLSGTTTIDGKALAAGDPVLLTAQTTGLQNGPWVVQSGTWTRPGDYTAALGVMTHARSVLVWDGNTAANKGLWTLSTVPTTVDTTATTWTAPPTGSGGGSSFYQTLDVNGSAQTQRGAFNFIAGANFTITPSDNAGAGRTDLTLAAAGGAVSPNPQPGDQNLVAWALDQALLTSANTLTPTAGTVYLVKMPVRTSVTFAKLAVQLSVQGSGVTPLANCFMGLYIVSSTNLQRIGVTPDQSTNWAGTTGVKSDTLTVDASQSLTQSVSVWAGLLIGQQSTTVAKFAQLNSFGQSAPLFNFGLTVGTDPLRGATYTTGGPFTALPATIPLANLNSLVPMWAAAL